VDDDDDVDDYDDWSWYRFLAYHTGHTTNTLLSHFCSILPTFHVLNDAWNWRDCAVRSFDAHYVT